MVGNFFVGNFQHRGVLQLNFLQKEFRQALVKAPPHDLLHKPHQLGEITAEQISAVGGHRQGIVHQIFKQTGGDGPELRILFRLDHHIELHIRHDAGCAEKRDIIFKKPADGNLPAIFRQNIGPELTGLHHYKAKAVGTAVMDPGTLFHLPEFHNLCNLFLLLWGQFVPNGKIF